MTYLIQPFNWRIVWKYVVLLMIPLGIAAIVPLVYALLLKDWYLSFCFLLCSIIVYIVSKYLRSNIPEQTFKYREGLVIVAVCYPIGAGIAAIPFILDSDISWIDAFFEAMSGVTTTGFTMLQPESLAPPLVLWRAIIQWIGGIGFILMFVGFLVSAGSPMAKLFVPETQQERIPLTLEKIASVIMRIYIFFTLLGVLLLFFSGMTLFDAFCFAMSAISTGGFSPYNDSAIPYPSANVKLVLIFLMIVGAIHFTLIYKSIYTLKSPHKCIKRLIFNPQLFTLISSLTLVFIIVYLYNGSAQNLNLFFTIVSAHTNTGFSVGVALTSLPFFMSLLIPIMFVGGCIASTTGGIKIFRALIAFQVLYRIILKPFLIREEITLSTFNSERLNEDDIRKIMSLILLQGGLIFIATMIFVGYGFDFFSAFFDMTSALSTVGLTSGIVDPSLPTSLKFLLILLMWMGRVEIFPVFILCYAIFRKGI